MHTWPGLPPQVNSRNVEVNDIEMHILEAIPPLERQSLTKSPLLILLHGFPELAYSWRKIMLPLASQGYLVIAPDQRGFGQTKEYRREAAKIKFEDDLSPFRMLNLAADIVALVHKLGYSSVSAIIGHDFGSAVAAHCALLRPDIFRSVVLMSAPFSGVQQPGALDEKSLIERFNDLLSNLDPPRKHYTMYFSSPPANDDMVNPPEGLETFLRTYYHVKSADWKKNEDARPLDLTSPAFSTMPYYYIMPHAETMPECLAPYAPTVEEVARNTWLPQEELEVYISQYLETGFQGGLNWYRCITDPKKWTKDLLAFREKKIDVPAMFIAGESDWGVFQFPGASHMMRNQVCTNMKAEDFVLVAGAGHWVQQEKPEIVVDLLIRFLKSTTLLKLK